METTYATWKQATIHVINEKTASFTEELHRKVETNYFKQLLEKMATHAASPETLVVFQEQMDELVKAIPTSAEFKDKELLLNFLMKKSKIKHTAKHTHKLVYKHYYMGYWMVLGTIISIPIGAVLGILGLFLLMGFAIGLAIGVSLDNKAAKEGRVL